VLCDTCAGEQEEKPAILIIERKINEKFDRDFIVDQVINHLETSGTGN